jgi:glutathione S-transferase
MARIVVLEKGLQDRVEVIAATTRSAGSPYYAINPSGRVPCLVCDDGLVLEESALVCDYLDRLDGKPALAADTQWEARRLEALARSLMDGLAVWIRELSRPEHERSPSVLAHEAARAQRLLDAWEHEIDCAPMRGPLNMLQITLGCALGMAARHPVFDWRSGHPKVSAWFEAIAARPSFAATAPPPASAVSSLRR